MKDFSSIISAIGFFTLILDQPETIATASVNRSVREIDRYTTKYDNIDVKHILQSKRLLISYVNCLLEKGPCTAEGKLLKELLPDALETECKKCSQAQKNMAGLVLGNILQYHEDLFDQLVAKYDPNGNFRRNHEEKETDDYSNYDEA